MVLKEIENLQFHSQLSLKQVEDRLLITADFSPGLKKNLRMKEPFLYVTLYVRGGARIKIIDEDSAALFIAAKKDFDEDTYERVIAFAKSHARQFKEET
ncbi:hypothetical protein GLW04_06545 [Halobacillus litoralis]|uniref:Uncharacterized protein n=1 Tax=Halobacillus litoralis TaxID=45668 RepID=A0A845DSM9_9BACI|nr:hypothetical protein [Halobacillus litoralis]MYL19545.1 hypothetical protein [Halobacillus litoralis]